MSTLPYAELVRRVRRDPLLWIAFGAGTGLSPKAPGTVGTLPGLLLAWIIAGWGLWTQLGLIAVLTLVGIWLCGEASRRLGVHDHSGIVFDEIVAMLIPFLLVPVTPLSLLLGFLWFRLFDVWKPWPIRWFDRNIHGGLGIMIDDTLAGILAAVALWPTLHFVVPWLSSLPV